MEVTATRLDGVLLIKPQVFEDHRGEYIETYNEELYRKSGITATFVQDDISVSTQHVLRGIHGDGETWKLISCLYGKFYLVVVNCDTESKDFGKWQAFVLSDRNRHQVLVPPRHGNGHLILSERAIFHYKQSTYYNPSGQFTYTWNDPKLKIWWPIKNPVLSQRDEVGHYV
ncbi:MAG: dTDP-4-dehydrorhamnose 3,5-epimerase family protein [Alphaproteobacteria bacterium]|uniref:dTDP-4-dehydrorhamnose 3,5-epimerase n=1 Tax=Candidatus Nitrobium versatile TaxID=2884831 RepID=A0A953J5Y5_9BACT|nr:dTDP-4-dehydrorhamnose 3,5-epimerase family protein [Candidatus Nitrobium versatile]